MGWTCGWEWETEFPEFELGFLAFLFRRSINGWGDIIKTGLRQIRCEDQRWKEAAEVGVQWQDFVLEALPFEFSVSSLSLTPHESLMNSFWVSFLSTLSDVTKEILECA